MGFFQPFLCPFLKAENEEVLKNQLCVLKAKIPSEFNLTLMDLKLLQTAGFLFYPMSCGNPLKQAFFNIENSALGFKALVTMSTFASV